MDNLTVFAFVVAVSALAWTWYQWNEIKIDKNVLKSVQKHRLRIFEAEMKKLQEKENALLEKEEKIRKLEAELQRSKEISDWLVSVQNEEKERLSNLRLDIDNFIIDNWSLREYNEYSTRKKLAKEKAFSIKDLLSEY